MASGETIRRSIEEWDVPSKLIVRTGVWSVGLLLLVPLVPHGLWLLLPAVYLSVRSAQDWIEGLRLRKEMKRWLNDQPTA